MSPRAKPRPESAAPESEHVTQLEAMTRELKPRELDVVMAMLKTEGVADMNALAKEFGMKMSQVARLRRKQVVQNFLTWYLEEWRQLTDLALTKVAAQAIMNATFNPLPIIKALEAENPIEELEKLDPTLLATIQEYGKGRDGKPYAKFVNRAMAGELAGRLLSRDANRAVMDKQNVIGVQIIINEGGSNQPKAIEAQVVSGEPE